MDINFTHFFNDFYHTRVFVLVSLTIFTFLFALKLDKSLDVSYWVIFLPLWIWKVAVILGLLIGAICWRRMKHRRFERDNFVQFKAMLISFNTNIVLFMFELIVCDKLESQRNLSWSICFVPLYLLSLISIGSCIWSLRYERSYEMELFFALSALQLVFVSLRLDFIIGWSWILVLIPTWIMMSVAFIILLYMIVLAILLNRSTVNTNLNVSHHHHHHQQQQTQQRNYQQICKNLTKVTFYSTLFLSVLVFAILLCYKLDHEMSSFIDPYRQHNYYFVHNQNKQYFYTNSGSYVYRRPLNNRVESFKLSYFSVSLPLYISYLVLILLSFNSHTGNIWWFGLRKDFCEVFLVMCPWCRTYGNISIKLFDEESAVANNQNNTNNTNNNNEQIATNANPNSAQSNLNLNDSNVASLFDGSMSNSYQTNLFRSTTNRSNQISLLNTINNELSLSLLEHNPSLGENEETRSVDMNAMSISSSTTTRSNTKKQRKRLNRSKRSLTQPKALSVRRSIQSVFNLNTDEPKNPVYELTTATTNKSRNNGERYLVLKSLDLPD